MFYAIDITETVLILKKKSSLINKQTKEFEKYQIVLYSAPNIDSHKHIHTSSDLRGEINVFQIKEFSIALLSHDHTSPLRTKTMIS